MRRYDDAAQAQRILSHCFGVPVARQAWAYLRRMLANQRVQWPWLGVWLAASPQRAYDMLMHASVELVLACRQAEGVTLDPFAVPLDEDRPPSLRGARSPLVEAWAEATAWAYQEARQEQRVWPPCDPLAADPYHVLFPATAPALSYDGVTGLQAEVLAARGAGLSLAEWGRLTGRSQQAVWSLWRAAVRGLLRANPWLDKYLEAE